MMMTTTAQPVEVFCSYAHKDEDLWQALKSHLSSLQRQHVISLWYDRELLPGMDWAREIDERLNSARLILLLISAYFLDSDYCYGIEMRRAMERARSGSYQCCCAPWIGRTSRFRACKPCLPTGGQSPVGPIETRHLRTWRRACVRS